MPCDVKLQINSSNLSEEENKEITLKKGVDESEINFESVVDYIINMPLKSREKLAERLASAQRLSLNEKDILKYNFISNTTIDLLSKQYPELNPLIDEINITPQDNYTIIQSGSKLLLGNNNTFGRMLDANGKEIFFISGKFGAQRFLQYIQLKHNINKAFKDENTFNKELSIYLDRISKISEHFKKKPKEFLLDYLNNNKKYKSFKDDQGNIVSSLRIILEILNKLGGEYNENQDKSDLILAIEAIKLKYKNNFDYKVSTSELYTTLLMFYNTVEDENFDIESSKALPSKSLFNKLSEDDLNKLLHRLFITDSKLYRAKITLLGELSEEVIKDKKLPKSEIESKWKSLLKKFKESSIELESLKDSLENKPNETIIEFLKLAFEGDERDINFEIIEGDIKATYKEIKTPTNHILITFPWSKLGEIYNFGYDSKYLFSPLKKKLVPLLDSDGKYKGMYIYEFYDKDSKITHYQVSRNIISPNVPTRTFNTLEGALNYIDKHFNEDIISRLGMWKMKMTSGVQREITLNETELEDKSLLTVLDLKLNPINFKKFPTFFSEIFNGTLPEFRTKFSNIKDIDLIDTPELAAYFILKFYLDILSKAKTEDLLNISIKDLISNSADIAELIIKEILDAKNHPITYQIEKSYSYIPEGKTERVYKAYIRKLNNNGNSVDITGKFKDKASVNSITIGSLNLAATYFNNLFPEQPLIDKASSKLDKTIKDMTSNFINVLSKSELILLDDYYKLGIKDNLDSIKAFVFLGRIIINSSAADISDLYHEMSHIFLGLVKVKYPDIYLAISEKSETHSGYKSLSSHLHKLYKNFAEEDILEEIIVSLIADNLFKKSSLLDGFEGTEITDYFNLVFRSYPKLVEDMDSSGLEFTGFILDLMTPETMNQVNRNMKISLLIQLNIKNKKIIKNCKG